MSKYWRKIQVSLFKTGFYQVNGGFSVHTGWILDPRKDSEKYIYKFINSQIKKLQ